MKTIYSLLVGAFLWIINFYKNKIKRLEKQNKIRELNEAYVDSEIRAEKERAEALEAAHSGRRDHFE